MKKLALIFLAGFLFACGSKNVEQGDGKEYKGHPEWAKNATIYELNTRQFTPEGTLIAAAKELPRLQELGVDVIWIMPIQKIGVVNRKGGLGSYYAIEDYCAVNPEFGNEADFKAFVDKAHQLGIKVILDWVANHTAPDHAWTKNEGWHLRDSVGNLVVRYDWTDIAELNYDNTDMRKEMIKSMGWWLDTFKIDGFRCDVAMEVPTDFWNEAIVELKQKNNDIFMLSEAELPELNEKAFDAYYGWDFHHIMNAIAQKKNDVDSLWRYFAKADTLFPQGAIRMNFTSNHDENSWNGTEYERMGDAVEMMAVLTFVAPGMPLIYTGQEVGLNHRLRFFDKDTVDFSNAKNHKMTSIYKKLDGLKKNIGAIANQPNGAPLQRVRNDQEAKIFSFKRLSDNSSLIGAFNMTSDTVKVNFKDQNIYGEWTDFEGGDTIMVEKTTMTMLPWQYFILYK